MQLHSVARALLAPRARVQPAAGRWRAESALIAFSRFVAPDQREVRPYWLHSPPSEAGAKHNGQLRHEHSKPWRSRHVVMSIETGRHFIIHVSAPQKPQRAPTWL